jgi:tellurite resistance protein TerC
MPTLSFSSGALFAAVVVLFLWLDLYLNRAGHSVRIGQALAWSGLWVALALLFAGYVGVRFGSDKAWLFLTGYLLEQSLSVDNLFVFIAIFSSFAIRGGHQHRILYYGILGAVVLRMLFIGLGTSLLLAGDLSEPLHATVYALFGAIVLASAYHMFCALGGGEHEIEDYTGHWSVRLARRLVPVSSELDGQRFFTRKNGRWQATPLFLCLVTVEASDLAFAVDSVPAVIAVTREPFLVYTSNIFAILGLRALYFLLAGVIDRFHLLKIGLALVLMFVGVKMLLMDFVKIPIALSLGVIALLLTGSIGASLLWPKRVSSAPLESSGD